MRVFDREIMRPLMLDLDLLAGEEFDSMSDEELFDFCDDEMEAYYE